MSKTKTKVGVTENAVSDDKRGQWAEINSNVGEWKMPPFKSEEEFAERCGLFQNLIAAKGEVPTAEKFAMFLGTSFHKLKRWSKGEDCPEARRDGVQEIITWIAAIWTDAMLLKVTVPTMNIWYGKQWFEQREPDSKVTLDMISPLKELPATASLAQKYLADVKSTELPAPDDKK